MVTVQNNTNRPTTQQANGETQTVRRGDTMSSIAKQHGVSLQDLIAANPQVRDPNLIKVGQQLAIPEARTQAAPTRQAAAPTPAAQDAPATRLHRITPGETLSGIAQQHGTTTSELVRLNNIRNPNLIQAGQVLKVPAGEGGQQTRPTTGVQQRPTTGVQQRPTTGVQQRPTAPTQQVPAGTIPRAQDGQFDGRTPAQGTTNTNAARPTNEPLNNAPGNRSAAAYADVVDQFGVGSNPRYTPRNGNTYCNIFTSDVMGAMGAPLPHWVSQNGQPAAVAARGAYELDANGTNRWLNTHGAEQGWRQVDASEAQNLANQGHPALASWNNPGGIGHIGVIRPGELTDRGPALAQAGAHNFNDRHLQDGFGTRQPQFWVHD